MVGSAASAIGLSAEKDRGMQIEIGWQDWHTILVALRARLADCTQLRDAPLDTPGRADAITELARLRVALALWEKNEPDPQR
jgi:hypothetical protein